MWCYHCVPLLVIQLVLLLCARGYTQYDRNQSRPGEVEIEGVGPVSFTPSGEIIYIAPHENMNSRAANDDEDAKKAPLGALVEGDITLGGLFPVHKKSQNPSVPCGGIQEARGIQRLEAMLFTIDEINQGGLFMNGEVKLGANILDTCSRDTYALEQSLEYVRASMTTLDAAQFVCDDGSRARSTKNPTAVVGVIGGSYSSVSIQVANLLRLFKIPQVSYASTSAALSDKSRFEYFARTVPADTFQARAMVDILDFYNWTYVSTVASEGDYGESGIDAFGKEARARNICIALAEKIPQSSTDQTFDTIIQNLRKKSTARVVILFIRVEDARELLKAAKRQDAIKFIVWVASDGWGTNELPVKHNELAAQGALTIELETKTMPEFEEYFKALRPTTNTRNPWFKEYWEKVFKCKFNVTAIEPGESVRTCTGEEKPPRAFKAESKLQLIYHAVYAMAYAIDNMLKDECRDFRDNRECARNVRFDGAKLYTNYILNVSFTDKYGSEVKFDSQGDGLGRYNILNYRRNRSTSHYEYARVGTWVQGQLVMDPHEQITWTGKTNDTPQSQCSKPCVTGQVKNVQGESCCWLCIDCKPWQIVVDEFNCADCDAGDWPTADRRSCYELEKRTLKWDSVFAIVPICLSILGLLLTFIVMFTFVHHRDTPVVKASGRELSFMLLTGFMICYLISFVLLLKPSTLVCAVQRFGVGFGFSVTYSSLLTKTNRISRIFDSASKTAKRPAFISPRSQVVIAIILILVQVALTVVWFVIEPPGVRTDYINGQRDQVVLKCMIKDISFLVSLTYNMLLIIICTVYAVKTRKIPENFNESKFIGFTMYTTCIIWLAFVPIYFGTLNSFEIQTTTLCVSISLSATVALLCLFTPKMYIIVFQPEKNVRKLTMNSATYKKAASSATFATTINTTNGPPDRIKMRGAAGTTTETETDRDSMASLMFDECPGNEAKHEEAET